MVLSIVITGRTYGRVACSMGLVKKCSVGSSVCIVFFTYIFL